MGIQSREVGDEISGEDKDRASIFFSAREGVPFGVGPVRWGLGSRLLRCCPVGWVSTGVGFLGLDRGSF